MSTWKAERRAILKEVKARGWRVVEPSGGGYTKILCPCGEHQRWVHFTPSDPKYAENLRHWLGNCSCWEATS